MTTVDECLHFYRHTEQRDFGYASYEKGDWVEDLRTIGVCDTCGQEFTGEDE